MSHNTLPLKSQVAYRHIKNLVQASERREPRLTKSATKQDEIEDVVSGKPRSCLYIEATRKFSLGNLEIGRTLLSFPSGNEVEQIQALLTDRIGMLKYKRTLNNESDKQWDRRGKLHQQ